MVSEHGNPDGRNVTVEISISETTSPVALLVEKFTYRPIQYYHDVSTRLFAAKLAYRVKLDARMVTEGDPAVILKDKSLRIDGVLIEDNKES